MELDGVTPTLDQIKTLALTNYGHFTSMLVIDGRVRGWSLHMQRLTQDCRLLFDVELDLEMVRSCVRRAVGDGNAAQVVRVTIYDPALNLGTIGSDANPHVLVTTRPASSPPSRQCAYRRRRINGRCRPRSTSACSALCIGDALRNATDSTTSCF